MKKQLLSIALLVVLETVFVRCTAPIIRFLYSSGLPWVFRGISLGSIYALLILVITVALFATLLRLRAREFGFQAVPRSGWRVAFVGFGALFLIALLGRFFDPSFDFPYAQYSGLLSLSGVGVFLLTLPIYLFREEVFLRFSQNLVGRIAGGMWAVMILSVNFAILHYPSGMYGHVVSVLLSVFAGSIVLATIFLLTKNLWLTFFVHVMYDAVITLQIYLHATGRLQEELVFWVLYGLLFAAAIPSGISIIRAHAARQHVVRRHPGAAILALICATLLPIVLLFAF